MIRRLLLALALGSALGMGSVAAPADAVAPVVGSCHRLTYAQATAEFADPSAPVPCNSPHTTQTIAVVTGPPLAGLTEDQIGELAAQYCAPALNKSQGNPMQFAQTAYQAFAFAPSTAEVAAGESWFRCDIGLLAGAKLQQLPKHLPSPLASRHLSDAVRQCLAGRAETTCNRPHTQRSIGAFRAPAKPFPNRAAFNRFADQRCPGATGYMVSTSVDWRQGRGVIVCFKQTHA